MELQYSIEPSRTCKSSMGQNQHRSPPTLMITRSESISSNSSPQVLDTTHSLSGGSMYGTSEPPVSLSGSLFLKPLSPRNDPFYYNLHQYQDANDESDNFFLASPEEIGLFPADTNQINGARVEDYDFEIEAINHKSRRAPFLPRHGTLIPGSGPNFIPAPRTRFVPDLMPATFPPQRNVAPGPLSSRNAPLPGHFPSPQTSSSCQSNARDGSSPPLLTSFASTPQSPSRKRRVTVDFTTPPPASKKRSLQGQYLTPCESISHCKNSPSFTPKPSCNFGLNFTSPSAPQQDEVVTRIPMFQQECSHDKPYQTPTYGDEANMNEYFWMNQGPPALKPAKREFI